MHGNLGHVLTRTLTVPGRPRRYLRSCSLSTSSSGVRPKSPHAEWYSQVLPSMIPIALLGSSVYIALHLLQTNLERERYADEAMARIKTLENELENLRHQNVSDQDAAAAVPLPDPPSSSRRWWFF
ncbi:hypothetical protein K439DRAFT_1323788 [Ramaria rubella]|nr:hypothetical protein K439DRAFT_1323788 [Ramaria rubella]